MIKKNENIKIRRVNAANHVTDIYHRLVRMRWSVFISLALLYYFLVNLTFGSAYYFFKDGLNPSGLAFKDCFFFSIHTFSTVGYGSIYPSSLMVHWITAIEIFLGIVSTALLTGLFFAKFSRPNSRFLFSEEILITKHRGRDAIVFRVANERSNLVMDASVSLVALYDEVTSEGIRYRRIADLELERSRTPIFSLSFTRVHYLEKDSFSSSIVAGMKEGKNSEFLVSLSGLDDTFGQTIHSYRIYRGNDMHWGGQFEDIIHIADDGVREIDFSKFDKIKN